MRKKSIVALALVATVVATTGCAGKKESSSATTSSAVTTTAEETTKKQEVSTAETAASDTVQSPSSDAAQNGESKGKEATSQQETTKQQAANDANTADAEPVQEEAAVNEDVEVLADIPDEVPLAAFTKTAETGYVTANRVNIRQQPSLSGKKMSSVNAGTKLRITGKADGWTQVEVNGKTGYVFAKYISSTQPQQTQSQQAAPQNAQNTQNTAKVNAQGDIGLDMSWKYANQSAIHSGSAKLYKASANRKGITIAVNAGHGTKGGESKKTLSHPDGSPKTTGGTNGKGAVKSIAVSSGMTFNDGTTEAAATLKMAQALKTELLNRGYDVVMIRDGADVQLDNIARTVIANNTSNAHIALHWDSTGNDKGAFYMKVPSTPSYKAMEPVASHWKQHDALGSALVGGLKGAGVKIFSGGSMEMDLTQTSYSTIPSVDIELGDKASDHSDATIQKLAKGLADGVGAYFGK